MNNRINELAEQCYHRYSEHNIDLEKFAELIVRECGNYLNSPEFIGRSDLNWAMILNEHFGVEE